MTEAGLLHRFEKNVYLKKKDKEISGQMFTIWHLVQIHCLLLVGCSLSAAVCFLEYFKYRKNKIIPSQPESIELKKIS